MKEVSFSWGGFNNAMISNLGMVLRNIYSKKSLNDYKVNESEALSLRNEGSEGVTAGDLPPEEHALLFRLDNTCCC